MAGSSSEESGLAPSRTGRTGSENAGGAFGAGYPGGMNPDSFQLSDLRRSPDVEAANLFAWDASDGYLLEAVALAS